MKVSRKEFIETLNLVIGDCEQIYKEIDKKELDYLSEVLGGHEGFIAWEENDILTYLVGVRDGIELLDNWRIDWSDEE